MIGFFVRHGASVGLLMVIITLFGLVSYQSLPRESSPDITIPVVVITTVYQGASPADVEGLVTVPLENELAGLRDVKEMTSTSAEGYAAVSIEFEPDVDIEDALQRVRDRVSRARSKLPDDVEEPSIREISFSDFPVAIVTVAGLDEVRLKELVEDLQDDATRIPGVLEANISGGVDRQIRVEVDPMRLAAYGLSFDDVSGALRNENSDVPGGDITSGSASVLIRTPGSLKSVDDLREVAIKRVGDRPVMIGDVATLVDGFEERMTYARMNGQPAVSLSVTKRPGANIIDVVDALKALTAEHAATWPEGASWRVLGDQSKAIRDMVVELENNILSALVLVVGVILVFMGARNSAFIAAAIPLSMLMSFAVLDLLGFTLNMIVLFSLILALGMLVDNGIVVVENVYRHIEAGKDRFTAAIDGTSEVAIPVFASTLTTVVAFFPMVFWTGIMGEFMGFLPKTVIIVLTASLIVAVWLLPAVLARFMSTAKQKEFDLDAPRTGIGGKLMDVYVRALRIAIRWRYVTVATGFAFFVFTIAAYALFNHGTEFFPETDPNRAVVAVRAPTGTDLDTTDGIVREVEAILLAERNVDVAVVETGVSGAGGGLGGGQAAPNEAKVTFDFLPDRNNAVEGKGVRDESSRDTIDRLRAKVAEIPGAVVTIDQEQMGPPVGAAIGVKVSGDDFHEVGMAAQKIRRVLATIDGVTDLRDDYRVGRPELLLRIDRGAAKRVGLSTAQIGSTVRTAVAGVTATTIKNGDEEWDVVVTLPDAWKGDLQSVLSIRVPGREDTSPSTFPVPLSSVASYSLAGGTGAIKHVDQDLVVTIEGDVLDGYNVNAVQAEVAKALEGLELPGIHAELGGSTDEQDEAAAFLGRALLIACALILLVLVLQFDSFGHPLIIFTSVFLSQIGVLWGLLLTGTPFGIMMTGIGVISLAGVVVNNAIVLLDYIELLRKRGVALEEALITAGVHRLRPVLLTAVTTVLGLLPMATGVSFDFFSFRLIVGASSAQWWGAMAWAVAFGLTFATVLTLVVVPTLYAIREDLLRLSGRLFGRKAAAAAAVTAAIALIAALVAPSPAAAITVDEAIAAAERSSVDLALVREQTSQAESLRGQAWATVSPQLIANGGWTFNQYEIAFDTSEMIPPEFADLVGDVGGEPIVIQPKTFRSANVSVRQPIFSATALPLLRGAYATVDAARASEASQASRIHAAVVKAFYGLATARQAAQIAELAAQNAEHQLALAERQVGAGLATSQAAIQGKLALSRAQREVAGAAEQVVAAEEAFVRLTGLDRDTPLELGASALVPPELAGAIERARARPDVVALERQARAADLQRNATLWGYVPRVDGTFSEVWSENTGFADFEWFWTLKVEASWTLWDGGLRLAQAKERASMARSADLRVEQQRRLAEEEVTTAWSRYERAARALEAVTNEVALAQENVSMAEAAFSAGNATWLDVESAQLGLASAQLAAVVEQMNRDLAALDVIVASGASVDGG
jgi:CzcA family heavy metal efflux pump